MKTEDIKPGQVYIVKGIKRRVIGFEPIVVNGYPDVIWEYADGIARSGRRGGKKWLPYFATEAKPTDSDLMDSIVVVTIGENDGAILINEKIAIMVDSAIQCHGSISNMIESAEGIGKALSRKIIKITNYIPEDPESWTWSGVIEEIKENWL